MHPSFVRQALLSTYLPPLVAHTNQRFNNLDLRPTILVPLELDGKLVHSGSPAVNSDVVLDTAPGLSIP